MATDVNTAAKAELVAINGLGDDLADAILAARPFSSADDLLNIKGIGPKSLNRLLEQGLTIRTSTEGEVVDDEDGTPSSSVTPAAMTAESSSMNDPTDDMGQPQVGGMGVPDAGPTPQEMIGSLDLGSSSSPAMISTGDEMSGADIAPGVMSGDGHGMMANGHVHELDPMVEGSPAAGTPADMLSTTSGASSMAGFGGGMEPGTTDRSSPLGAISPTDGAVLTGTFRLLLSFDSGGAPDQAR